MRLVRGRSLALCFVGYALGAVLIRGWLLGVPAETVFKSIWDTGGGMLVTYWLVGEKR